MPTVRFWTAAGVFACCYPAPMMPVTRAWSSQSVVVSRSPRAAEQIPANPTLAPGLAQTIANGNSYEGFVDIPSDGGYTLTLLTSTTASLFVDDLRGDSQKLRPQVCGSPGNGVQPVRVSAALSRGVHRIKIVRGSELENAKSAIGVPD